MNDARSLLKIVSTGSCVGCGLCEAVSPSVTTMAPTRAGYVAPAGNVTAAASARQHCPSRVVDATKTFSASELSGRHPLWGVIRRSYVGWSTNPEVRFGGSSGGVLTQLLVSLMEQGHIDAAVVNGTSAEIPFANRAVLARSTEEILRSAGSRYAPSSPLVAVRQAVDAGLRFAFVGKPCDVAALRSWMGDNPQVAEQCVVVLSFFCAGIPSWKGPEEVIQKAGFRLGDVIKFRYRGNGWPGMTRVETSSGDVAELTYEAAWGTILNRHLHPRCKLCADGCGELADIVCGDAWETASGYPDFSDRPGRSLVLARTAVGERFLELVSAAQEVELEVCDVRRIATMQPYQVNRKTSILVRTLATRLTFGHVPKYTGFDIVPAARIGGLRRNVKNLIGTLVRRVGLSRWVRL